jgi:hypothetical protein
VKPVKPIGTLYRAAAQSCVRYFQNQLTKVFPAE